MHSGRNRQTEVTKSRSLWSSWSFSRKLFVLLIFPLAVQLALFVVLCVCLSHAQSLSERQFQDQRLISSLDQVLVDKGTSLGGIINRSITGTRLSAANKAKIRNRIFSNLRTVRENPTLDADLARSIDKLELSYTEEFDGQSRIEELGLMQKVRMMDDTTYELQKFHDQIVQKLDANQLAYAADRRRIGALTTTLIAGVFLDLCAAFVSLYLFNRGLNVSLKALIENSKQISSEAELPHHLDGSDELSTIDDALHRSHRQLREAKKQRQEISNMIAHDVRTPLLSISLLINRLSIELAKTANPLVDEVRRLEKNMQSVHKHVDDLLVVEKLDAGKVILKLSEVNLGSLLGEVCNSFTEVAAQKQVRISLQASDCLLIGDSARLSQVIQNYLSNAIKYSHPGGMVTVQLVKSPELISVRVKDDGVGIKQADQAHLFSKFYQAGDEKSAKGFGLGLSICKELIELHGGEVGVTSRSGAGSTFWFSLPVDDLD